MKSIERTERTQTGTNGKARVTKENPLQVFEKHAKLILSSDRSVAEKSVRLLRLGKSIDDYLIKLDVHMETKKVDTWTEMCVNRSRLYLAQLADDVRNLAVAPKGLLDG